MNIPVYQVSYQSWEMLFNEGVEIQLENSNYLALGPMF